MVEKMELDDKSIWEDAEVTNSLKCPYISSFYSCIVFRQLLVKTFFE